MAQSKAQSKMEIMHDQMREYGFNGQEFAKSLIKSCDDKRKRGEMPRQNRYFYYCWWAVALKKSKVGPEDPHYEYPKCLLDFIRDLVPGDIKGEIREDAFKVSLDVFCRALNLPCINE